MLDIDFVRTNPDVVKKAVIDKLLNVDVDELLKVDATRRSLEQEINDLRQKRNELAKNQEGKPSPETIAQGKELKEAIAEKEETLAAVSAQFSQLLFALPNIPTDDTPVGKSEDENVVLREVGEKPSFSFEPKPHWELGTQLGVIDNEQASEVSGSRFTYLKGDIAWLQIGLTQLALSVVTDNEKLAQIAERAGLSVSPKPFTPVIPPHMIRPEVFQKMARLEPQDERYYIESDDLFLIGSAEHTLGPLHMNQVLNEHDLPLRYVGISPAYRREAGSHGKDVRGILRLHQFDKIEMESFTLSEDSLTEQHFIVAIQEHLMNLLQLPYQVILKCTADMGTPDARAIDIETWMPGQGAYRETHTSDLMTDYQSRRLLTKVKRTTGGSDFVHMNDATAFAIGRTIIAIMENYQQSDGSISVPQALQPYVPFTLISPRS